MTLDEAITYAEETAEELKWKSKPNRKYPCFSSEEKRKECQKRGEEHSQIAEWLKELKELKEQEPILDKIRDEIEEKYGGYDICEWFEDYDYEENDISEYRSVGNVSDILAIIDKYRAEGSEK
jgi:hypothetical protein